MGWLPKGALPRPTPLGMQACIWGRSSAPAVATCALMLGVRCALGEQFLCPTAHLGPKGSKVDVEPCHHFLLVALSTVHCVLLPGYEILPKNAQVHLGQRWQQSSCLNRLDALALLQMSTRDWCAGIAGPQSRP